MKKRILIFLTIAVIAVIFVHSSMTADTSAVESDTAFELFRTFAQAINLPNFLTATSIRKVAHFIEFSIFGILLTSAIKAKCGKIKPHIFTILFFLLFVPVIDELIQVFSDGRTSNVSDILLDFSGGVFGFLLISLIYALARRLHNKDKHSATVKIK